MDECQRLAPGVVEHLRRMGFEVRAVAAASAQLEKVREVVGGGHYRIKGGDEGKCAVAERTEDPAPALPTESELAEAIWKGEKNWNEDKNAPLGAPSLRACIARAVLDLIVSKGVRAERRNPSPAQRPFVPSTETVNAAIEYDNGQGPNPVTFVGLIARDLAKQAAGTGGK
jgi:hypothetical protein